MLVCKRLRFLEQDTTQLQCQAAEYLTKNGSLSRQRLITSREKLRRILNKRETELDKRNCINFMRFGDVSKPLPAKSHPAWATAAIGDYHDFYLLARRIRGHPRAAVREWSAVRVPEMDFRELRNAILGYVRVAMGEDPELSCGVKWWVVLHQRPVTALWHETLQDSPDMQRENEALIETQSRLLGTSTTTAILILMDREPLPEGCIKKEHFCCDADWSLAGLEKMRDEATNWRNYHWQPVFRFQPEQPLQIVEGPISPRTEKNKGRRSAW